MRIAASIAEATPVQRIRAHIGEPTAPPLIAPARGPPTWDNESEPMQDWDLAVQPDPGFEFDQRFSW